MTMNTNREPLIQEARAMIEDFLTRQPNSAFAQPDALAAHIVDMVLSKSEDSENGNIAATEGLGITPGKWTIGNGRPSALYAKVGDNRYRIAQFYIENKAQDAHPDIATSQMDMANAQFASAAPDMYDACQKAMTHLYFIQLVGSQRGIRKGEIDSSVSLCALRDALAKARGEVTK